MTQIETVYIDGDSNQITSIGANAFNGCSNMAGHVVVPRIAELGDGPSAAAACCRRWSWAMLSPP